jgi:hypothetical protein
MSDSHLNLSVQGRNLNTALAGSALFYDPINTFLKTIITTQT